MTQISKDKRNQVDQGVQNPDGLPNGYNPQTDILGGILYLYKTLTPTSLRKQQKTNLCDPELIPVTQKHESQLNKKTVFSCNK